MIRPRFSGCLTARVSQSTPPQTFRRYKSITAAIERGRQSSEDTPYASGRSSHRDRSTYPARDERRPPLRPFFGRRARPVERNKRIGAAFPWERDSGESERERPSRETLDGHAQVDMDPDRQGPRFRTRRDQEVSDAPEAPNPIRSLLYSTAASEFIYGFSSVFAALRAGRRRLYNLYVHDRCLNNTDSESLVARAKFMAVRINVVGDEYLPALDKASKGRPHNGVVLEASPLPVPPITALQSRPLPQSMFGVALGKQSKEDMTVNGTRTEYEYDSAGWRHPLVLYVDGVLNEGNLGAIARSVYFLGVDAIVTPTRRSAPWSDITIKAAAGAAEGIPIFSVAQPADFLGQSARDGWRIYAADAVPASPPSKPIPGEAPREKHSRVVYTIARSLKMMPADHCPVQQHPTLLMMGDEGTGLRSSLLNAAHFKVGIRHSRQVDHLGVDSLNVSVAAGLLCYEILQKPQKKDLLF
ncbi:unnamed protein product [Periconia digitata]|uniref:rRNA methyltransferase 1, mitochondrial n=1 Tax=Periconia digitata TaxID=1303443 RepID=A0A9W4XMT5_9PLEO|nr:unnamed protein product [Periconia digitata]